MKIAVTSRGQTLDDQVETRFGRSPYFVIVDINSMNAEAIENPNTAAGGGAGIQSAQLMAEHNVKVALTGNCGPNAFRTLEAADIKLITGVSGTVREAALKFKNGEMSNAPGPNVQSHSGMQG